MLHFLLAEESDHKLDHEKCGPSTSRTLTLGICHLAEPGCHNTETWICLVSQGLLHCLSPDDMLRSHIGVSSLSICPAKNSSEEVIRGGQQKVIHTNTDLHPTPLPSEGATRAGRDVAVTTGPFPNAPHNSVLLDLLCFNGFLPTGLPYVQDHSIARCMSKFSFLKCNFPQNLLASYNAASWLQKQLFCHLGPK